MHKKLAQSTAGQASHDYSQRLGSGQRNLQRSPHADAVHAAIRAEHHAHQVDGLVTLLNGELLDVARECLDGCPGHDGLPRRLLPVAAVRVRAAPEREFRAVRVIVDEELEIQLDAHDLGRLGQSNHQHLLVAVVVAARALEAVPHVQRWEGRQDAAGGPEVLVARVDDLAAVRRVGHVELGAGGHLAQVLRYLLRAGSVRDAERLLGLGDGVREDRDRRLRRKRRQRVRRQRGALRDQAQPRQATIGVGFDANAVDQRGLADAAQLGVSLHRCLGKQHARGLAVEQAHERHLLEVVAEVVLRREREVAHLARLAQAQHECFAACEIVALGLPAIHDLALAAEGLGVKLRQVVRDEVGGAGKGLVRHRHEAGPNRRIVRGQRIQGPESLHLLDRLRSVCLAGVEDHRLVAEVHNLLLLHVAVCGPSVRALELARVDALHLECLQDGLRGLPDEAHALVVPSGEHNHSCTSIRALVAVHEQRPETIIRTLVDREPVGACLGCENAEAHVAAHELLAALVRPLEHLHGSVMGDGPAALHVFVGCMESLQERHHGTGRAECSGSEGREHQSRALDLIALIIVASSCFQILVGPIKVEVRLPQAHRPKEGQRDLRDVRTPLEHLNDVLQDKEAATTVLEERSWFANDSDGLIERLLAAKQQLPHWRVPGLALRGAIDIVHVERAVRH
mmetsp:Transcript_89542/g.123567  ORF Transcript_89542/g.123567 Transcript_89542/m.123567 type:complete len:683 (-) Transcript_89542:2708-4756(-)